jgi:hypothetical protein
MSIVVAMRRLDARNAPTAPHDSKNIDGGGGGGHRVRRIVAAATIRLSPYRPADRDRMFPLPLMFGMLALVVVTVFFPPVGLALLLLAGIGIAWAAWAKARGRNR